MGPVSRPLAHPPPTVGLQHFPPVMCMFFGVSNTPLWTFLDGTFLLGGFPCHLPSGGRSRVNTAGCRILRGRCANVRDCRPGLGPGGR